MIAHEMARPDRPLTAPRVVQEFPGAKVVTTLLFHTPAVDPPVALVGSFDRTFRRRLERLGAWSYVTVVKRGQPIPESCINVIAADNASLNLLIGSAIGFDDVELSTLEGDMVTDGDRLIFCASPQIGEYAWKRWWRFLTEGHVGSATMLPITCHRCEAHHRSRWLWTRDARGVGWCEDCFENRTVPASPPGVSADDHNPGLHRRPERNPVELDDAQRNMARLRRLRLARARAANNRRRQEDLRIADS